MIVTKVSTNAYAPELRGSLASMKYPAFSEIKLDGEFNYIYYADKQIYTKNKYGKKREGFNELNMMKEHLERKEVKSALMLCELYWEDGKLGRLYDLLSHKTDNRVHIDVFDVMMKDNKNVSTLSLLDRKELLWEMLDTWQVRGKVVQDGKEATESFNDAVSHGWEGVVIKSMDSPLTLGPCSWVKMKYKDQSNYEVGFIDPHKERIEVLVPDPKALDPITVGVKAPNRYKKHIKVGDMVTIEHQGVLASGSLRHPVLIKKPEW